MLFWGDAGWVRFFSKEPGAAAHGLPAKMKMFAWAGDNPQVDIMKALGYQPVVLEIADILPGLQTGMIDMVPSTPFYALVGQFYGHASLHARHELGADRRRGRDHAQGVGRDVALGAASAAPGGETPPASSCAPSAAGRTRRRSRR